MKNLTLKKALIITPLICCDCVFGQQPQDGLFNKYKEDICEKLKPLPSDSCESLIKAAVDSQASGSYDKDKLVNAITNTLTGDPIYGNSALSAAFGNAIPLNAEFKTLESKDGNSVLGLTYGIQKKLKNSFITPSERWTKSIDIDFNASGTLTQNKIENPRNFLDTKFSAYLGYTTRIPIQSLDFGHKLTDYAFDGLQCDVGDNETQQCKKAKANGLALLESTTDFLSSFQRYSFGLDVGYETDQSFTAKQEKISAFIFGQFESWGSKTFLSALNVNPTFRVGLDSITPNADTPRAKAGDDSKFYRISSEVSFWIPLNNFKNVPVSLTFNYRYFKELNPSDIIKDKKLDSDHLATWSLTGTNGLFVSYSSGKLPFDIKNEDVVELGWKTYF